MHRTMVRGKLDEKMLLSDASEQTESQMSSVRHAPWTRANHAVQTELQRLKGNRNEQMSAQSSNKMKWTQCTDG